MSGRDMILGDIVGWQSITLALEWAMENPPKYAAIQSAVMQIVDTYESACGVKTISPDTLLDLVADNMPDVPLSDLAGALVLLDRMTLAEWRERFW